jgi:hypothetical protein
MQELYDKKRAAKERSQERLEMKKAKKKGKRKSDLTPKTAIFLNHAGGNERSVDRLASNHREYSLRGSVLDALKELRVKAQKGSVLLGGQVVVDVRFNEVLGNVTGNRPVALEVDGPSHFLLQLPDAARCREEEEEEHKAQIHEPVDDSAVDDAKTLDDLFAPVVWGALCLLLHGASRAWCFFALWCGRCCGCC